MSIITATRQFQRKKPSCVVTIGIFDGVHRGHIHILKRIIACAKKRKLQSLLISFFPHPRDYYRKQFPGYLTTPAEKIEILKTLPLDYVWMIRFNKRVASMKGQEFFDFMYRHVDVKKIIVASDFRFGHNARCGVSDLRTLCERKKIDLETITKIKARGRVVNSSLIRALIHKGDFSKANIYLGRHYSIGGVVYRGANRGRRLLGVPTVNISVDKRVLPGPGVYITMTKYKNRIYKGVSNLGAAPTFNDKKIILETHLFNFNKSIYKEFIEVFFVKRLRKEKKFSCVKTLILGIKKDILAAKKFFAHHNILGLKETAHTTC